MDRLFLCSLDHPCVPRRQIVSEPRLPLQLSEATVVSEVNEEEDLDTSLPEGNESKGFALVRAKVLAARRQIARHAEQLSNAAIERAGAIGGYLSQQELLSWVEKLTASTATIYDKALDAEYLRTHIGGGNHRLFDGGHDLISAWGRVRDASGDDSFEREVLGYVQALWKDLTTSKGLPFTTWDEAQYSKFSETLARFGVSKQWSYDLISFDVFELFSAGLGVAGLLVALQRDDVEKLSELLGAMGITSILSANPIAGLAAIAVTAYAYHKKRHNPNSRVTDGASFAKGALIAGIASTTFMALSLPMIVELAIVLVVVHIARRHADDAIARARALLTDAQAPVLASEPPPA